MYMFAHICFIHLNVPMLYSGGITGPVCLTIWLLNTGYLDPFYTHVFFCIFRVLGTIHPSNLVVASTGLKDCLSVKFTPDISATMVNSILQMRTEQTVKCFRMSIVRYTMFGKVDLGISYKIIRHCTDGSMWFSVHTLRPRQTGHHLSDDIFRCIFLNENISISIDFSLKCVQYENQWW